MGLVAKAGEGGPADGPEVGDRLRGSEPAPPKSLSTETID